MLLVWRERHAFRVAFLTSSDNALEQLETSKASVRGKIPPKIFGQAKLGGSSQDEVSG